MIHDAPDRNGIGIDRLHVESAHRWQYRNRPCRDNSASQCGREPGPVISLGEPAIQSDSESGVQQPFGRGVDAARYADQSRLVSARTVVSLGFSSDIGRFAPTLANTVAGMLYASITAS